MDSRKEVTRLLPRVLFFALILLLSHVLEIQPSDFDAGGIKLALKDVVIIRGGIALLFLFHFYTFVASGWEGLVYYPLNANKRVLHTLVADARKPYLPGGKKKRERRTPKQVKRLVWWWIFLYNLFMMPFSLTIVAMILAALVMGFYDAYGFGEYLINRLIEVNGE